MHPVKVNRWALSGGRRRLTPLILSITVLVTMIACGVEAVGSESVLTPIVPQAVELADTRVIVTSSQGDQILYAEGWTFDGPDQADTVAFSTGTPDSFRMVIIRPVKLSSAGESLNSFSQKARDDLQESLELRRGFIASARGSGSSKNWWVDFDLDMPAGPAAGIERHLVHDGIGYVIRGVWTKNSNPAEIDQVEEIVKSFAPAAGPTEEFESEVKRRIEYERPGELFGVSSRFSLGHYMALEDASLWEVALADRIMAMKIGINEQFRVEPQDAGSSFPYVLAHTPGSARLPAFYVGKGESILK